jgi:8-oxo-dGTP diphosphatase
MYISNKSEKPRNPIPTVTIIIKDNSESNNTLLIRRAREPFKDHFSLPDGFVDYGERVEDAVKRERQRKN